MLSAEEKFIKFMQAKYEKKAFEEFMMVSDGSQLRILRSSAPEETRTGFTLLLIPGWASVVQGWDDVLLEAYSYFDIVYFESREKGSSKLVKKAKGDLDRLSSDIKEVIEQLKLEREKLILFSSSFGSVMHAHGLAHNKYEALLNILVGASTKIELPFLTKYLVPWAPPLTLNIFKPISRFWIKRSKSENPEQAAKYIRVLDEADAKKWQMVGKHVVFSKFWNIYEKVEDPVLIIGMEKDKFHEIKDIRKLASLMKNSSYLDMKTNKNTHSAEMVKVIRKHLLEIQNSAT